MRRGAFIIIIFTLILLFSCDVELLTGEENINDYIYPYLEFTPTEEGDACTATVVDGASLEEIYIPSFVELEGDAVPVVIFTGFQNQENAESVKTVTLGSNDTSIAEDALKNATNLETVKVDREEEKAVWGELSVIEKPGYEFDGWYIEGTDKQVREGDTVIPGFTTLVPRWKEHTLVYHEAVNATCTVNGKRAYYKCQSCNRIYTDAKALNEVTDEDLVILASHTLEHIEGVEATCTSSGNPEYYRCTVCSMLFSDSKAEKYLSSDDIVLPAKGHAAVLIEATDATCMEEGNTAHYRCERCGHLYSDESCSTEITAGSVIVSALGHDWTYKYGERIVDGHWQECTRCHETKDSAPHTFTIEETTLEPTHEKAGTKTLTCHVCSAVKTEDITPIGDHNFVVKEVVPPSCEERGYTVYECTVRECDSEYKDNYTDPTGHTLVHHEKVNATCTSSGTEAYYQCSVCQKYFGDAEGKNEIEEPKTIPAAGHKYGNLYVEDKTKNVHYRECLNCRYHDESTHVYNQEEKDGHAPVVSATCTTGAVYYKSCVCGKEGTSTFSDGTGFGHSEAVKHEAVESNCSSQGYKVFYTCSKDCCKDKFYSDEALTNEVEWSTLVLPLSSHVYTNKNFKTTAETHTYICDACHREIKTENHTKTYEHDFYTHHWKCDTCGYTSSDEKHTMTGEKGKQKCFCGYIETESQNNNGSFKVEAVNDEPEGYLTSSKDGIEWTFTLVSTNDEKAKPESYRWFVDGTLEKRTDEDNTFVLAAPEKCTYRVMCVFSANGYTASDTMTVFGGI